MKFEFFYSRGKKELEVVRVPWYKEGIGLMFSSRKKAKALLFDLGKISRMAIHSLFVFFPFIAIWLDEEKKVIEIKRVEPFSFRVLPKEKFRYLIEVPLTKMHDAEVKTLLDKETFK